MGWGCVLFIVSLLLLRFRLSLLLLLLRHDTIGANEFRFESSAAGDGVLVRGAQQAAALGNRL